MNITAERLNRGLTLSGAAAEIGVHRATLASVEAGGSVHPANAKLIADYFGCKVTDLMPIADAPVKDAA